MKRILLKDLSILAGIACLFFSPFSYAQLLPAEIQRYVQTVAPQSFTDEAIGLLFSEFSEKQARKLRAKHSLLDDQEFMSMALANLDEAEQINVAKAIPVLRRIGAAPELLEDQAAMNAFFVLIPGQHRVKIQKLLAAARFLGPAEEGNNNGAYYISLLRNNYACARSLTVYFAGRFNNSLIGFETGNFLEHVRIDCRWADKKSKELYAAFAQEMENYSSPVLELALDRAMHPEKERAKVVEPVAISQRTDKKGTHDRGFKPEIKNPVEAGSVPVKKRVDRKTD